MIFIKKAQNAAKAHITATAPHEHAPRLAPRAPRVRAPARRMHRPLT